MHQSTKRKLNATILFQDSRLRMAPYRSHVDTGELIDSSSVDIRTSLSDTMGNISFRIPWAYYLHASNICWDGLMSQSLNEKEVWQALWFSSYKITALWDEFSVSSRKFSYTQRHKVTEHSNDLWHELGRLFSGQLNLWFLATSEWQPVPLATEKFPLPPAASCLPPTLLRSCMTVKHLYRQASCWLYTAAVVHMGYPSHIIGKQLWLHQDMQRCFRGTEMLPSSGDIRLEAGGCATWEQRDVPRENADSGGLYVLLLHRNADRSAGNCWRRIFVPCGFVQITDT